MARRLILVDLYWTRDKDPRVPLGHASLLAHVRRFQDLDVRSFVAPVNAPEASVSATVNAILDHAAGCADDEVDVAFGAYVWNEHLVAPALGALRRAGFRGRILLGGPQISYCGEGLERAYPEADVFIRGFGEEALAIVARNPHRRDVVGAHLAGTTDEVLQASIDLERLASPFLDGIVNLNGQRFIRWETQRGCPFRCAFCQHREAGQRMRRRHLALTRIEREVDLFCRSGVDDIAVLDPVFNLDAKADDVLARLAEQGYRGRLSLQCRAELVRPTFLEHASALRTKLEFGLQTIHDREQVAIERKNDLGGVDSALRSCRERGIDHEVTLIFGLPEQTLDSFVATVTWCIERRVPTIRAFPLLLLRGTPLERDRDRWGLVDEGGPMSKVVASNSFSRADWERMASISDALSHTEGRHPESMQGVLTLARELARDDARWRP